MRSETRRYRKALAASAAAIAIMAATAMPAGARAQGVGAGAAQDQVKSFNVPAQSAVTAIPELARQADVQILVGDTDVRGKRTPAVTGTMSVEAALRMLLDGSGLTANTSDGRTYTLAREGAGLGERAAGAGADGEDAALARSQRGISEILVVGSRTQNVDVRRTEDDPVPYVIFGEEEIKRSNATTLDDFLRARLPMNTQSLGIHQTSGGSFNDFQSNAGQINLRGLGTNQTLVLVDGRRMPGVSSFDIQQANISGIPLSQIERVEILPSTAGAIYGGSAVGGVVNIILKHNYRGLDLAVDYGNTFDGATGDWKFSANGGITLGSTKLSGSFSYTNTGTLLLGERLELQERSRRLLLSNVPGAFTGLTRPPMGAMPNICSATLNVAGTSGSCNNTLLVLKSGTPVGSSIITVPEGYAGPASDAGLAFLGTAGAYNLGFSEANTSPYIRGTKSMSAGINVRQPITKAIEAFADFNWSKTPSDYQTAFSITAPLRASDARNPFQQNILVSYFVPDVYRRQKNTSDTYRLSGGLIFRLPHRWSASLEHAYGVSRFSARSVNAPFSPLTPQIRSDLAAGGLADPSVTPPGPFDIVTDFTSSVGPSKGTASNSAARASGPLFELPAGPVNMSTLAERRKDVAAYVAQCDVSFGGCYIVAPQSQTVLSGYAETLIPLFSDLNSRPLLRELELQLSVRHDNYKTIGASNNIQPFGATLEEALEAAKDAVFGLNKVHSTDYLVGLRYKPVRDLTLRASYSTGFLPPSVGQITSDTFVMPVTNWPYLDPKRGEILIGDANGDLTVLPSGNPNLKPETSKSLTFGAVFTPSFVPGLRFSVDYTKLKKQNEIQRFYIDFFLANEDSFPGRITRGAPLPGDPPGTPGPVIAADWSPVNVGASRFESIDFQIDYDIETTNLGAFHVYGVASHAIRLDRKIIPDADYIPYVDYSDGSLKWRGNIGLDWRKGPIRLGWNMQYYSSYAGYSATDPQSSIDFFVSRQGTARIPSQTYHDISAGYSFEDSGMLSGLEISGGIQNLFDKKPPTLAAQNGSYSSYGDPRLRRFTLTLRKHF